jgi:uncharacterized protein YggU (UPF0235/DUF167 family)
LKIWWKQSTALYCQCELRQATQQFAIAGLEEASLKIRLRAKPEKGKANQKLVKRTAAIFWRKGRDIKRKKNAAKKAAVARGKKPRFRKPFQPLKAESLILHKNKKGDLTHGKNIPEYCKVHH